MKCAAVRPSDGGIVLPGGSADCCQESPVSVGDQGIRGEPVA